MKAACLLLILLFSSLGIADGMPVPDPSVYYSLSEDHQIAVITIQEDLKASVDLFISISDYSGESHRIQFILPFYESPESFEVTEKNLSEVEEELTGPMDDFIIEFEDWDSLFRSRITSTAIFPLLPTFLLPILGTLLARITPMAYSGDVNPIKTIETEHSKVEIYNVTEQQTLENILSRYELDENITSEYSRYTGKYLYFVTLDTVPSSGRATAGSGILFSFISPLVKNGSELVYTYPLGTGSAWPNPIRLTRVYVRGPAQMLKKINFPYIAPAIDPFELEMYGYKFFSGNRSGTLYYDAQNPREKMYRILYFNSNPSEEVHVRVTDTPPDVFKSIEVGLIFFVYDFSAFLFILLYILFWTVCFAFFIWPHFSKTTLKETFRSKEFYKKDAQYLGLYLVSSFPAGFVVVPFFILFLLNPLIVLSLILPFFVTPWICNKALPLLEKQKPNLYRAFFFTGFFSFLLYALAMFIVLYVFVF